MPSSSQPSLGERVGALRNLPPFLKLVWRIGPGLALADAALRLVGAALPVAILYVGKLIIDEVVRLSRTGAVGSAADWWPIDAAIARLAWLLMLELGLAIAGDVIA